MITATATASRLSDLTDDTWLVVASQPRAGANWIFTLPPEDEKAFKEAVAHGEIISPQRMETNHSFTLLAKLARVRGARR